MNFDNISKVNYKSLSFLEGFSCFVPLTMRYSMGKECKQCLDFPASTIREPSTCVQ